MQLQIVVVSILCLLHPIFSRAELGISTLPQGITSPSVRFGLISKLDQQYTEQGTLARSIDLKSVEFDAQRLSQLEPRVQSIVDLFNQFGFQFGNQLHMGSLRIESKPEIQYTGLILAHGINDRLTVGGGVPIVRYKNQIRIWQTRNNLDIYQQQAQILGNQALIDGVEQLAQTNVPQVFQSELRRKGYEELSDQDETIVGDLQLSALYKLKTAQPIESLLRLNLNLPTGPKHNPDNLAALNQFGYTYVEPQFLGAYNFAKQNIKLTAMLGARLYWADQAIYRVPKSENDILPDVDQKENLNRRMGSQLTEALQLGYQASDSVTIFGVSEWKQKEKDSFSGDRGGRYDLLSEDTDSQSNVVSLGLSYSTVQGYLQRKQGAPMILTAQMSDTISGKNIERQQVQEVSAIIFF